MCGRSVKEAKLYVNDCNAGAREGVVVVVVVMIIIIIEKLDSIGNGMLP